MLIKLLVLIILIALIGLYIVYKIFKTASLADDQCLEDKLFRETYIQDKKDNK